MTTPTKRIRADLARAGIYYAVGTLTASLWAADRVTRETMPILGPAGHELPKLLNPLVHCPVRYDSGSREGVVLTPR